MSNTSYFCHTKTSVFAVHHQSHFYGCPKVRAFLNWVKCSFRTDSVEFYRGKHAELGEGNLKLKIKNAH